MIDKKYHWVIWSPSKKKIWKEPFVSLEGARHELELQMRALTPEQTAKADWKLEMREDQYPPKQRQRSAEEQRVIKEYQDF